MASEAARRGAARNLRLWLVKPAVQLDVYIASPETWGSITTLRTGSADFARALVTAWKQRGGRFQGGRVYCPGGALADTPEERDVFRVTGYRWVEPERRSGAGDLDRLDGMDLYERDCWGAG